MKLTHIFWTLFLLVILIYVPSIFYRTNTKLGGGPDLFAFYVLLWILTSAISPIFLAFWILKAIKKSTSFLMTLLVIFNLYFGSYGIYMILSGQISRPPSYVLALLILNLVWAVTIAAFAIRNTFSRTS